MKKFSMILVLVVLAVFLAGNATAYPINTRPVAGLTSELNALQTYLNGEGQTIDVYTDQDVAAYWTTTVSENSAFTLMLETENTTKADNNSFGLYNYGDPATLFEVFDGTVGVGWAAFVSFNSGGIPGRVAVSVYDAADSLIKLTFYNGVNPYAFGFYLDSTGAGYPNEGLFFSEDALNSGGVAQSLVYATTGTSSGQWWIAWEHGNRNIDSDSDFNDMVVFAESINPVPEPITMLLLGFGFLGLGLARRKS